MSLEFPYLVFGQITDSGMPCENVLVYAKDLTNDSAELEVFTDSNGQYIIDIASIANDGDSIHVWCFNTGDYDDDTFVLDITGPGEEINLYLGTYPLSDNPLITDNKTLDFSKILADNPLYSDGLSFVFNHGINDTITVTDTLLYTVGKMYSDIVLYTDSLSIKKYYTYPLTIFGSNEQLFVIFGSNEQPYNLYSNNEQPFNIYSNNEQPFNIKQMEIC